MHVRLGHVVGALRTILAVGILPACPDAAGASNAGTFAVAVLAQLAHPHLDELIGQCDRVEHYAFLPELRLPLPDITV